MRKLKCPRFLAMSFQPLPSLIIMHSCCRRDHYALLLISRNFSLIIVLEIEIMLNYFHFFSEKKWLTYFENSGEFCWLTNVRDFVCFDLMIILALKMYVRPQMQVFSCMHFIAISIMRCQGQLCARSGMLETGISTSNNGEAILIIKVLMKNGRLLITTAWEALRWSSDTTETWSNSYWREALPKQTTRHVI